MPQSGDFITELEARLSGVSARQLAKTSGWGRTTVSDIVKGRRLPTQEQLEDLLMAAGVDEKERKRWASRLAELTDPMQRRGAALSPSSPPRTKAWHWRGVVGVGGLLVCFGVVARLVLPTSTQSVGGEVRCLTGAPVTGVWLAQERGDGTWARVRPGADGFVVFNGEVKGDHYRAFVGCSGTPQQWGSESRSGTIVLPDVTLVCDDRRSSVTVAPYYGRCDVVAPFTKATPG